MRAGPHGYRPSLAAGRPNRRGRRARQRRDAVALERRMGQNPSDSGTREKISAGRAPPPASRSDTDPQRVPAAVALRARIRSRRGLRPRRDKVATTDEPVSAQGSAAWLHEVRAADPARARHGHRSGRIASRGSGLPGETEIHPVAYAYIARWPCAPRQRERTGAVTPRQRLGSRLPTPQGRRSRDCTERITAATPTPAVSPRGAHHEAPTMCSAKRSRSASRSLCEDLFSDAFSCHGIVVS